MSTKNGYYSDGYYSNNVKNKTPYYYSGAIAFTRDTNVLHSLPPNKNSVGQTSTILTSYNGLLSEIAKSSQTVTSGCLAFVDSNVPAAITAAINNSASASRTIQIVLAGGTAANDLVSYPDLYFKNGVLATGVYKGVSYVNGLPLNGVVAGKYYINGVLGSYISQDSSRNFTGVVYKKGIPFKGVLPFTEESQYASAFTSDWNPIEFNTPNSTYQQPFAGVNFVNGIPAAAAVNGFQYGNDGKLVTGIFNNRYYDTGSPVSGVFDGVLYKNGTRFTGSNVIWTDIRSLDANAVTTAYPQFTYIAAQANCIYNWLGYISSGNEYNETPLNAYFFNGTLANGLIAGKMYANGILLSGDQVLSGVLYKNGAQFSGTLTVPSSKQVTFGGTTFSTPSSGAVIFANGEVAHGFVGGKFFDKGIQIKSTQTCTLQLSSGVIANGVIGGVTYKNGITMY